MLKIKTKAETLESLEKVLTKGLVLPQIRFTVEDWNSRRKNIMEMVHKRDWLEKNLIVRSSALNEDSIEQSMAGHFLSIGNIYGELELKDAIEKVIESFNSFPNENNQIFIQPMLQDIKLCGVAFSKDPNTGSDYYVINYDDSGSTDSVTSGSVNTKVTYIQKTHNQIKDKNLDRLIHLIEELENLFENDSLDVEFAVTKDGKLYLLQVRPLCVKKKEYDEDKFNEALDNIYEKIKKVNLSHPYLYGERTVFGVMPDWNPAEIIGIRPKPLALSLYKEIVTDNIWAYQRHNYGYKNLRSFPLMYDFCGLPYIDVRVSFNSFLPRDLDDRLCEKLTNYYINKLIENPSTHDKVEFDIIFSCYTLDLPDRIKILKDNGFTDEECEEIAESLRTLTNNIINFDRGLWKKDINKIDILKKQHSSIISSKLDKVSKIYWLIEDCKRYGTLPFAGLARAGFIAVQMLKSLVSIGILSEDDYHNFMKDVNTVSSAMKEDFNKLNKTEFLKKYGHLRPGTYDILSSRYDKEPELYFDWNKKNNDYTIENQGFSLTMKQLNEIELLLKKHNLDYNAIGLLNFLKTAIEGREYSKFVFTRSLSDALQLLEELIIENGFSIENGAHMDINIIKKAYSSSHDIKQLIEHSFTKGKENHKLTEQIVLPPLITDADEVWSFKYPDLEPNYITLKETIGNVKLIDENVGDIEDSILLIRSADPGYDWIFSHNIKGFITMYGGINSHMAIRAGELDIPAVIGVGEQKFNQYEKAEVIKLECANRKIRIIK